MPIDFSNPTPAQRWGIVAGALGSLSEDYLHDIGPRLTCNEAEMWVMAFDYLDLPEHALALKESHADGDDDDGDQHALNKHGRKCDGWCGIPGGCLAS